MSDLSPLTLLLQENERQRDAALAEHQRAINAAETASAQTAQLREYRRDYEQRWSTQFQRGGPIELVHCYQSFTDRMTKALDQQMHVVERAHAQVARALTALSAAELRCASVRKLLERRVRERQLAGERRDQKHSDELATRAAWDRREAANRSHSN